MTPAREFSDYLLDMVESAHEATQFIEGMTFEEFKGDRLQ